MSCRHPQQVRVAFGTQSLHTMGSSGRRSNLELSTNSVALFLFHRRRCESTAVRPKSGGRWLRNVVFRAVAAVKKKGLPSCSLAEHRDAYQEIVFGLPDTNGSGARRGEKRACNCSLQLHDTRLTDCNLTTKMQIRCMNFFPSYEG